MIPVVTRRRIRTSTGVMGATLKAEPNADQRDIAHEQPVEVPDCAGRRRVSLERHKWICKPSSQCPSRMMVRPVISLGLFHACARRGVKTRSDQAPGLSRGSQPTRSTPLNCCSGNGCKLIRRHLTVRSRNVDLVSSSLRHGGQTCR